MIGGGRTIRRLTVEPWSHLGQDVPVRPPPPTWTPEDGDPIFVPDELAVVAAPKGMLYSWYNPIDWATEALKGVKKVGGWAWDGAKWVYNAAGGGPCFIIGAVTIPLTHVPGLKAIVRKYGCSTAGQALGTIALVAFLHAQGAGPLATLAGTLGAGMFYSCLCARWQQELNLPPAQQLPPGAAPTQAGVVSGTVVVGVLAAAVAVAYAIATKPKNLVVAAAMPPSGSPVTPSTVVPPKPSARPKPLPKPSKRA